MKFNRKYILISAILIIAIVLTCTGLIIKRTSDNPQLMSTPAIAVPFAVVYNPDLLVSHKEDPHLPSVDHTAGVESPITRPEIIYGIGAENVPEDKKKSFVPVTEDYFADALFIGDSRTVGLGLYAPIGDATYFGSTGMTSYSVFDVTASDTNVNTYLETLLTENTYGKIYFMIGINELGSDKESQREAYLNVIKRIRAYQPNATIFLMANLSVTRNRSNSDAYINRDSVTEFNQWIQTNANGVDIIYLDANFLFCDEEGYLKSELSWDGAHVYASVYTEWSQYLLDHGIE